MAYPDKKQGKHTGSFVGEWAKGGKKRRFKTLKDAQDYETFCKLLGREPPTITDDGSPVKADGEQTFAEVAALCKAAGGPEGLWHEGRDNSVIQRLEHCVTVIGHYGISRVTRAVLEEITADLRKRPARCALGEKKHGLSNGTINRYLNAASAVLTYAELHKIISHRPRAPLLPENGRERAILPTVGEEAAILRLMRDAGHHAEALCVEALLDTGLREGELLGLQPHQITFVLDEEGNENGWINLYNDETKGKTARRVLIEASLGHKIKGLVASGALPKAHQLLRRFKSAAKRAGYPENLVIHSLRHTLNTRMRQEGVDIKIRMKKLGHKSPATSMRYDHVTDADQLEAAKKLRKRAGMEPVSAEVVDFPKRLSA
jgi:integrase